MDEKHQQSGKLSQPHGQDEEAASKELAHSLQEQIKGLHAILRALNSSLVTTSSLIGLCQQSLEELISVQSAPTKHPLGSSGKVFRLLLSGLDGLRDTLSMHILGEIPNIRDIPPIRDIPDIRPIPPVTGR